MVTLVTAFALAAAVPWLLSVTCDLPIIAIAIAVGTEDIPHVLVGNKNDLVHEREVAAEEGQRLADEWGVPFIESSAKYNTNVEEVFRKLIATCETRSEVLTFCINSTWASGGEPVLISFDCAPIAPHELLAPLALVDMRVRSTAHWT